MKRLTRKDEDGCYCGDMTNYEPYLEKLGQLEDIEQELGVDLITLVKALIDGAYNIQQQYKCRNLAIGKYEDETDYFLYEQDILGIRHLVGYLKDFGKTWSTRKEDLENEKDTHE